MARVDPGELVLMFAVTSTHQTPMQSIPDCSVCSCCAVASPDRLHRSAYRRFYRRKTFENMFTGYYRVVARFLFKSRGIR